jgi:hypothetical protein
MLVWYDLPTEFQSGKFRQHTMTGVTDRTVQSRALSLLTHSSISHRLNVTAR